MTTSTFEKLLTGSGIDLTPERMRWMVLTWDFAYIDEHVNKYLRILLSADRMYLGTGRRRESCFSDTARPRFGEHFADSAADGEDPLVLAHESTDTALSSGYRMVCRPLALDLSALVGSRYRGSPAERPSDLFDGLRGQSKSTVALLREVNCARTAALATHLDPQAPGHFPELTPEDLWAGRS